jgi:hypothetical protein
MQGEIVIRCFDSRKTGYDKQQEGHMFSKRLPDMFAMLNSAPVRHLPVLHAHLLDIFFGDSRASIQAYTSLTCTVAQQMLARQDHKEEMETMARNLACDADTLRMVKFCVDRWCEEKKQ